MVFIIVTSIELREWVLESIWVKNFLGVDVVVLGDEGICVDGPLSLLGHSLGSFYLIEVTHHSLEVNHLALTPTGSLRVKADPCPVVQKFIQLLRHASFLAFVPPFHRVDSFKLRLRHDHSIKETHLLDQVFALDGAALLLMLPIGHRSWSPCHIEVSWTSHLNGRFFALLSQKICCTLSRFVNATLVGRYKTGEVGTLLAYFLVWLFMENWLQEGIRAGHGGWIISSLGWNRHEIRVRWCCCMQLLLDRDRTSWTYHELFALSLRLFRTDVFEVFQIMLIQILVVLDLDLLIQFLVQRSIHQIKFGDRLVLKLGFRLWDAVLVRI
jgi:hypothetical protein